MEILLNYKESRLRLLNLRHNNQRYWIGLAISYHLLENYESAEKVLKAYVETLKVNIKSH